MNEQNMVSHGDTPMGQNWYAHICQRAKTILSYNQFTNIYSGVKTSFLEFFSVIQAVKKYLKQSAWSSSFD